jgi:hypothetical protein
VGTSGTMSLATLTYNGNAHKWAVQASAGPSSLSGLLSVSCPTGRSLKQLRCTAVGSFQRTARSGDRTLAIHYRGQALVPATR